MAFFKFGWFGQKKQTEQAPVRRARVTQTESVEDMRRRARHRLIGAAVLVVVGVIVFPILFDTQPRTIAVDVPIEIPDRDHVAPLVVQGPAVQDADSAVGAGLGAGESMVGMSPAIPMPPEPPRLGPEPKVEPKPESKPYIEPKPEPKLEPKPEVKPRIEPKPESKPEPKPDPVQSSVQSEAARARALLEGRSPAAQPAAGAAVRLIVQVGAFADASKAAEVRGKLERAGIKTYAQVVDTANGKRTRVRVGPFNERADAEKMVNRIKELGLAASVLTL